MSACFSRLRRSIDRMKRSTGVNIAELLAEDYSSRLFRPHRQTVPNLDEIYELELAFYENEILSDREIVSNAAYFSKVGDSYTRHFQICTGDVLKLASHSSSRLRSFFAKNIFRTGYATHGLFPYRGKFHPQMIKGLINVMGLKPGDSVLDPMAGSGTVPVEAVLMGMNAFGVDRSPFCRFMAQTKVDALTMSLDRANSALGNRAEVYDYFANRIGTSNRAIPLKYHSSLAKSMSIMEESATYVSSNRSASVSSTTKDTSDTYNFLLLAYLDSVGYAERSRRAAPIDQFSAILERYLFAARKIQTVLRTIEEPLGTATIVQADARNLPLRADSIDGIIFSPPYSFAIDYLENDSFHLKSFGVSIDDLRSEMIGLRGRGLREKFQHYKCDMNQVLAECARVLRNGCVCCIIIGTNSSQLSKILGVPPDEVKGLHELLGEQASEHGFVKLKSLSRPITGIANTMRREHIIFLQKN